MRTVIDDVHRPDWLQPVAFPLPPAVRQLGEAQAALREHHKTKALRFTLDGRLVGDIAEALAIDLFGLVPCHKREKGIDARTRDHEKSVQVKSSCTRQGPAFSQGTGSAEYLIFMWICFDHAAATILYNGPEEPIRKQLMNKGQTERIKLQALLQENSRVPHDQRLPLLPHFMPLNRVCCGELA